MWWNGTIDTTPIYVEKMKREKDLCTVTVKWDKREYICYGPALGWTCTGYSKRFCENLVFSTDYDTLKSVEDKRENDKKYAQIGRNVHGIVRILKMLEE